MCLSFKLVIINIFLDCSLKYFSFVFSNKRTNNISIDDGHYILIMTIIVRVFGPLFILSLLIYFSILCVFFVRCKRAERVC